MIYDVIIIGGGVAGLSAALLLGRCGRQTLVCDEGKARNRFSSAMHGFLSRDGISPTEFLTISREQVTAYPSITLLSGKVTRLTREANRFTAFMGEKSFEARTVLLAIGIVDTLPPIPNIADFYGKSVHHCPYCDGWEHRNTPIAVHGHGEQGMQLAREMRVWSSQVTLCTHGEKLDAGHKALLLQKGLAWKEERIIGLTGNNGNLTAIRFADGDSLNANALFFSSDQQQNCDVASQIGCTLEADKFVTCMDDVKTSIPHVFAAGNTTTGLQLAIVAAAEGAKAAHAIHEDLLEMDQNPYSDKLIL